MHILQSEQDKKKIQERYFKALQSLSVNVITPGKGDKWQVLEGLVADYAIVHPQEIATVLKQNAKIRSIQDRDTGSSKQKSMRHALRIPAGLLYLIKQYCPEALDKKNIHLFMRKFPGFSAANRV